MTRNLCENASETPPITCYHPLGHFRLDCTISPPLAKEKQNQNKIYGNMITILKMKTNEDHNHVTALKSKYGSSFNQGIKSTKHLFTHYAAGCSFYTEEIIIETGVKCKNTLQKD